MRYKTALLVYDVVEKNMKSRRIFIKIIAMRHTKILGTYFIISDKNEV